MSSCYIAGHITAICCSVLGLHMAFYINGTMTSPITALIMKAGGRKEETDDDTGDFSQ